MITYARMLLRPAEVLRLDARQGLRLACEAGNLWITTQHDRLDHHLEPGESLECGAGRILAEGPGTLVLSGPDHPDWLPGSGWLLRGARLSGPVPRLSANPGAQPHV